MTSQLPTNNAETLPIEKITLDPDIQVRSSIRPVTINKYSQQMKNGDVFPPVDIFFDGTHYWLADGVHRVKAAQKVGLEMITAYIHEGSHHDAILFAVDANQTHGLPLNNADKRRVVEIMLKDPEWSQWSDREIARRSGASNGFVSKLRKELSVYRTHIDQRKRKFQRDDQTHLMNVGNRSIPKSQVEKDRFPESQSEKLQYLKQYAPEPIKQRFQTGDLSVNQACKLAELVRTCCDEVRRVVLDYEVSDPNIIPMLEDQARQNSRLFRDIAATGLILAPGSDEPIHISEANKRDIEDAVLQNRFYHRLAAAERMRQNGSMFANEEIPPVTRFDNDQFTLPIPADSSADLKASDTPTAFIASEHKQLERNKNLREIPRPVPFF